MIARVQCSVKGCFNSHAAKGMCARHYAANWREQKKSLKQQPIPSSEGEQLALQFSVPKVRGSKFKASTVGIPKPVIRGLRGRIQEYKMKRGCLDCGYNSHPEALEFDHLPGSKKLFKISDAPSLGKTWSEIQAEASKCQVVCANCHRIRTVSRRK
jgi:hypothetical protein